VAARDRAARRALLGSTTCTCEAPAISYVSGRSGLDEAPSRGSGCRVRVTLVESTSMHEEAIGRNG